MKKRLTYIFGGIGALSGVGFVALFMLQYFGVGDVVAFVKTSVIWLILLCLLAAAFVVSMAALLILPALEGENTQSVSRESVPAPQTELPQHKEKPVKQKEVKKRKEESAVELQKQELNLSALSHSEIDRGDVVDYDTEFVVESTDAEPQNAPNPTAFENSYYNPNEEEQTFDEEIEPHDEVRSEDIYRQLREIMEMVTRANEDKENE